MKKLRIIIVGVFTILLSTTLLNAQNIKVLAVMSRDYGPNTFFTLDDFEAYGWDYTMTGVNERINPCPLFDGLIPLTMEVLVSEITDITEYDVIAIMPASWRSQADAVYTDLLESPEAIQLIKSAIDSGLVVYATCAGVRVLAAAGVISGKNVVGTSNFKNEFEAAGATYLGNDSPPVIDGNIVTSVRGQYYHIHNCQAIATALENSPCRNRSARQGESDDFKSDPEVITDNCVVWHKTFGGSAADGGRSVCETADGGLIIAGYTYSSGNGSPDVYVIKTDAEGNEVWSKSYGGPGWEFGNSVCQTQDGHYLVVGYTTSFGEGSKDIYLLKLDTAGDTLWTKTYGGPAIDVGRAVCVDGEGNYIICGYTESYGAGEDDVYIIATDKNGDILWLRNYGGERTEMGRSIQSTNDGGFVVAGATGTPGISSSNQDFYLIKTDAFGGSEWRQAFGANVPYPFDFANSAFQTREGGYIIVGDSNIRSPLDILVIKTDATGNESWQKNYGEAFYDHGNAICETDEGGYLICGATKVQETNKNELYLVKIDSLGNQIWKKMLGGEGSEWGSYILKAKDGSFIIVGHTSSFGAGNLDVWLLKISNLEPAITAEPIAGKVPLNVHFTDQSAGDIVSWKWDFENDEIFDSETQNPTWTYQQPGVYSVKFEISNGRHANWLLLENFVHAIGNQASLLFDAEKSTVTCPATSELNLTDAFTFEAWIHPHGWGEQPAVGFGKIIDKKNIEWCLINTHRSYHDQCLFLKLAHENGTTSRLFTPANSIQLNQWQHVAITFDGDTTVQMLINGVVQPLSQTSTPAGKIQDNHDQALTIGNNAKQDHTFDGMIDEVRIWSSARPAAAIQAHFEHYLKGDETGLIGYWKMDEGEGEIIADHSAHDNSGQLVSTHWRVGVALNNPVSVEEKKAQAPIPSHYQLYPNYPNPFNPETTICYDLPTRSRIRLQVYNVTGNCIKMLLNEKKAAGSYKIKWDGTDEKGIKVSSGVYFYQLTAESFHQTEKMLLLR